MLDVRSDVLGSENGQALHESEQARSSEGLVAFVRMSQAMTDAQAHRLAQNLAWVHDRTGLEFVVLNEGADLAGVADAGLTSQVGALAAAIDEQNQLLGQIVAQNADLLSMLVSDHGDEPRRDLSGKPL